MNTIETKKAYTTRWILLLAILTAIAPLSTDMYLPALPEMAKDFGVSTLMMSNSLPAYFLGIAVGQLIYGPISDRIGRKKPLIFGLGLHIIASIACIYVDDVWSLFLVRVLQALGSCVGLVLARAAIRDVMQTNSAAKAFASMMMVMGIAPILAPTLGAWLLVFFSWQSIFIALFALGVVSLIWVIFGFQETLAEDRWLKLSFQQAGSLYVCILKDRSYIFPMLAGCFSFGVLFCYINAASTVLMDSFQLSQQQFAYAFGFNALGSMILSAMNHKLAERFSVVQRLSIGGMVQLMGALLLICVGLFPFRIRFGDDWLVYGCCRYWFNRTQLNGFGDVATRTSGGFGKCLNGRTTVYLWLKQRFGSKFPDLESTHEYGHFDVDFCRFGKPGYSGNRTLSTATIGYRLKV